MKTKIILLLAAAAALAQTAMAATSYEAYVFKCDAVAEDGYFTSAGTFAADDGFAVFDLDDFSPSPILTTGWKIGAVFYAKKASDATWYVPSEWSSVSGLVEASSGSWSVTGASLKIAVKDGYNYYCVRIDPITYSISFDKSADDASETMDDMTGISYTNTTKKLTANKFTRTGYTFEGWTNSTGAAFADQTTVGGEKFGVTTDGETVNLYAKWTANSYSISYNEDGGTAGASRPTSAAYGVGYLVSAPTKTGSKFTGWKLSGYDSSTARYGVKEEACESSIPSDDKVEASTDLYFRSLASKNGVSVTLVAQWSVITTSVTFSGEGAETTTDPRTIAYGQVTNGFATVAVPTKTHAQFLGYFTAPEGGVKYFDSTGHLVKTWDIAEESITLYAHWQVDYTRTSKLVLNGGNLNQEEVKITIGQAYGNLPEPEWTDYKKSFAGWSTNVVNGEIIAATDIVPDPAPETIYAQWTNSLYKIHFYGNEATGGEMSDQSVAFNVSTPLTANGYSRTGYAFAGWGTNATTRTEYDVSTTNIVEENNKVVTNITTETRLLVKIPDVVYADCEPVLDLAKAAGATVKLYAVWSTNRYYVVFDTNGGSGTMPTLTNFYGVSFTLPANKFTRTGLWTFDHWEDSATGKTYADGATVENLTSKAGATVTLKAVWSSTLTDLSLAMHCETMSWTNWTTGGWAAYEATDAGYNASGSCARHASATSGRMFSSISWNGGTTNVSGTLTFWWKPSSASATLYVGVSRNSSTQPTSGNAKAYSASGTDWQKITHTIEEFSAGSAQQYCLWVWNVAQSELSGYECIDQMKWTLAGTSPEPTPADAVTVSSFAASSDGAGWTLAFTGSENFSYRVLYKDSLTDAEWKELSLTDAGDGTTGAHVITITRDASVPSRFYKVETIQRP